jgi:peptidoglycan/LPS O-acetylase OafA/YrhL
MFLRALQHFRGIAVLFVVAGHSFMLSGVHVDTFAERMFGNLVAGGTFLFVFLSGFLFQYHSLRDFRFGRFLASRMRYVLLPYLLLSAIPIGWALFQRDPMYDGMFLPQGEGLLQTWLIPGVKYLATGRVVIAYWFIPYVMLNFAFAPAHAWFARSRPAIQAGVFSAVLAIGLMVHKPLDDIGAIQGLVYFLPTYLVGILAAQHRDAIFRVCLGKEPWILMGVFALAALQALQRTGTSFGNYHGAPFAPQPFDLLMPQKLLLCLFLLLALHRWEDRPLPFVGFLAKYSLAIFFLHPLVLWSADLLGLRWTHRPAWLAYPLVVMILLAVSSGVAAGVKRLLGQRSRLVIGS